MTNVYQGSDLKQIVDEMIPHMKTQIENPVLLNSRFRFDEALFLDANFHQLNLTRGSSYLPLPDWLARKKAIPLSFYWGGVTFFVKKLFANCSWLKKIVCFKVIN